MCSYVVLPSGALSLEAVTCIHFCTTLATLAIIQGALPVLVGWAGVVTLARTSRFRGHLNATRGGLRMAPRSL